QRAVVRAGAKDGVEALREAAVAGQHFGQRLPDEPGARRRVVVGRVGAGEARRRQREDAARGETEREVGLLLELVVDDVVAGAEPQEAAAAPVDQGTRAEDV